MNNGKKGDIILTIGILIIVVFLVAFNVYKFYGQSMALMDKEISIIQGKDAETFVEKDLNLPKGKIILNVWATWCSSCVDELPILQKASEKIEVIGILKPPYNKKAFEAFKAKYNLTYKNLLVDDSFVESLNINAVPTSILIENNRVKDIKVGTISLDDISNWTK